MNDWIPTAGPMPGRRTPESVRPRRAVFRLGALSQRVYAAHTGHIIAASRMVAAFVLLLFALTHTPGPWLRIGFDDVFAVAFAGIATTALIVSLRSWYLDFVLSEMFIALDILAFVIFTASRTSMNADAVASALCLVAHILFVSVLRWRSGRVFAIAVFLNTFWVADIALFELPRGGIDPAGAVRWSLFVALETVIVIWASVHKLKTTLPRFAGHTPGPGLPSTVSAVGYAAEMTGAGDAVLCWIDRTDRGCHTVGVRALEEGLPPGKLSFSAGEAFKGLAPMLFDVSRDRAIVSDGAKFTACHAFALPGRALLRELGVDVGICIPVDGEEGRAWLILTGIPMLGWGILHLAEVIRSEIAQGMAWQTASTNALNSALFRLRRTVACDLHDSVAHSLAGARFLLVALRSRIGAEGEVAREIDTIKDALDAEHIHVRRLIEQLRETDSDVRIRNLIEDLDAVAQALELRWQIEVELTDCDYRIQVPVWLSMEIQQIVREAISNAVRHGKASRVTIKCVRRLDAIETEVTDNGSGFAHPQTPVLPRSISERLGELGGALEIHSRPGSTTLQMSIPSGVGD